MCKNQSQQSCVRVCKGFPSQCEKDCTYLSTRNDAKFVFKLLLKKPYGSWPGYHRFDAPCAGCKDLRGKLAIFSESS